MIVQLKQFVAYVMGISITLCVLPITYETAVGQPHYIVFIKLEKWILKLSVNILNL